MFVGDGAPGGVVKVKRFPQALPSPAVPPPELIHGAITSPSALISSVGTVKPLGTFVPGEIPVAGFTSSLATVKAEFREPLSPLPDPTVVYEVI